MSSPQGSSSLACTRPRVLHGAHRTSHRVTRSVPLLVRAMLCGAVFAWSGGCARQGETPPPLPSTSPAPVAAEAVTLQGETMGTTWSVKVTASTPEDSRRVVELEPRITAALERVNDLMSTYREQSELSRFNRHTSAEPFSVSPETAAVVRRALAIGTASGGALDVTLGPLIRLWGFDRDGRRLEPPSPDTVEVARAKVGLDRLEAGETTLRKTRPDVEVNLSAIAKGYGVDVVFALLREAGFPDVFVEIGGEVRASGRSPRGEPWRVGVNVPRSSADPTAVLVAVPLAERAIATSGDYRNFFEAGGRRYSHIIDPRTAAPVDHDLVSVSVLADDCTTADGLATALLVLGEERGREVLQRFPGTDALFVRGVGAELEVTKTQGFPAP